MADNVKVPKVSSKPADEPVVKVPPPRIMVLASGMLLAALSCKVPPVLTEIEVIGVLVNAAATLKPCAIVTFELASGTAPPNHEAGVFQLAAPVVVIKPKLVYDTLLVAAGAVPLSIYIVPPKLIAVMVMVVLLVKL